MRKIVFLFSLTLISFHLFSQDVQLSPQAELSVVVADPGTRELFEAFGHPAIRVYDSINQIDLAFNYGIFDFDQPYFYLNFTRGYLNYMVQAWPYPAFENTYVSENRSLKEYILNLTPKQKQDIFNFLLNNVKPENRHYFYDYFYDNCSTRIWDVFEKTLATDIHFDSSYLEPRHTFRTLVDSLTVHKKWGDFGIDLCLGLPMDKKLNSYEYMFLPEFLGRAIDHATINIEGNEQHFVKESKIIFQSSPKNMDGSWLTPNVLFWSIFVVVFILTIFSWVKKSGFIFLDLLLFGTAGLVGLLLFILWVATDHNAAANNLNIVWANPLYLIGIVLICKKKQPQWTKKLFLVFSMLLLLLLVSWPVNPQGLNAAVIPIALTLCLRSLVVYFKRHLKN